MVRRESRDLQGRQVRVDRAARLVLRGPLVLVSQVRVDRLDPPVPPVLQEVPVPLAQERRALLVQPAQQDRLEPPVLLEQEQRGPRVPLVRPAPRVRQELGRLDRQELPGRPAPPVRRVQQDRLVHLG